MCRILNAVTMQHNQTFQSYMLDIEEKQRRLVQSWLLEIESDFEVVLILEELDLSLAVMAIQLCWTVEDVVHFKLNSMSNGSSKDLDQGRI